MKYFTNYENLGQNYGGGWTRGMGAATVHARTVSQPNYGQGLGRFPNYGAGVTRLGAAEGEGFGAAISSVGGLAKDLLTGYWGYKGNIARTRADRDIAREQSKQQRFIASEAGERTEGIVKLATLGFLGVMGLVGIGMLVTVTRRKNPRRRRRHAR